ncbi:predicted Fe-S oxidoreductases [Pelotomaculum thermopropionicum SI]|uniref:Predicted Fe-S oxidoreductases n=1 Tax=Pelotomaculum thermopropionicum (strain DSM 13744 / JCM 10971 / SI) TaxID=370438 RepID=A5D4R6_PELTS|nr:predicted Fe-S oxidoreductases [Pelotomaculum thermopropionicum SI]
MKSSTWTMRLKAPVCLTWQITGRCNLSCIHCLAGSSGDGPDRLSMGEVRHFLDDLARMKVFYINIGGGEPLLHPRFFDIVDYALKRDIYVQFSTNGTLIDRAVAAEIAGRGLRVQVSLDGWKPAVNDPVRGRGTFQQAVKAIRLLRERNVDVSVNCVVTRETIAGLDEMLRLANRFGAGLRLSRLRPAGRARDRWRKMVPDREQYRRLYHWLMEHPEVRTGDSFFFLSAFGAPLPGLCFCGAGKLTCSVDPAGNVYPCPFTVDKALIAGNIREKPLSELWLEGLLNYWPAAGPEACRGCPAYGRCRGGCRGASFLVYGNCNMADPECLRGVVNERAFV